MEPGDQVDIFEVFNNNQNDDLLQQCIEEIQASSADSNHIGIAVPGDMDLDTTILYEYEDELDNGDSVQSGVNIGDDDDSTPYSTLQNATLEIALNGLQTASAKLHEKWKDYNVDLFKLKFLDVTVIQRSFTLEDFRVTMKALRGSAILTGIDLKT